MTIIEKLSNGILEHIEERRCAAGRCASAAHKTEMGQFFTPLPIARLMASMLNCDSNSKEVRILDAGAGVGSLFASVVEKLCERKNLPDSISVDAYEVDPVLLKNLHHTMSWCQEICESKGIKFSGNVIVEDFIKHAADQLENGLFNTEKPVRYTCAIMNPPYRKINTDSNVRRDLRRIGIETSNLYAGFVAAAIQLLEPSGEIVAITPRSFCNGPYFRPFRQFLLTETVIQRAHIFESRTAAFKDDDVLQENIIFHAVKGGKKSDWVTVTSDVAPDTQALSRRVRRTDFVRPNDPELFIHIAPAKDASDIVLHMNKLDCSLSDLDMDVSTGRVVEFRAKEFLRALPEAGTAPLIYPVHFEKGFICWPKEHSKKPNAILLSKKTLALLVPNGNYVLTKRFSTKEEPRRIVAVLHENNRTSAEYIGFENHLNYFHRRGSGLDLTLAHGLAAFLNSTMVDLYFRQFNGHTQVNATDLRNIRYPSLETLLRLGTDAKQSTQTQASLDELVSKVVFHND